MKKATKLIVRIGAIAVLSAAIGGITASAFMNKSNKANVEFSDAFQQNNVKLASYGTNVQPVDLTEAAEIAVNAVVHIKSTQESRTVRAQAGPSFEDIFGDIFGFGRNGGSREREYQTPERVGIGSGVIISSDGYIVTNNHVVADADIISVRLNDNREFKGRVIGTDPSTDLALVKIEGDDFPTLKVGNSDALKVGEWVLAVGNPFNLTSTVTAGIVSAKARTLGVYSSNNVSGVESFIQTDAAINQGNSGGALVNARGELVGINAVLSSPTGAYAGYGFAIPTSIMTKVVTDLKQYGSVQRAMLGIRGSSVSDEGQQLPDEMKKKYEELGSKGYGVYVAEVIDGGSAAGILKKDDIILTMDGKKIENFAKMQEILATHRPGDKVTLTVLRNKKEQPVSMTLKNEQGNTKMVKSQGLDAFGAAFREIPDNLKKQLNLSYGLEVTGISQGKFADVNMRKGFIILKANLQPMRTVDDLEEALKAAQKTPEQTLFISGMYPSGKRVNYAIDLGDE